MQETHDKQFIRTVHEGSLGTADFSFCLGLQSGLAWLFEYRAEGRVREQPGRNT